MRRRSSLAERASGVLLHPTSLPGPHGCGDLGAGARSFARFLAAARQRYWQMLPVGPVGYGNSPYSAHSAFAGSSLLIDLAALREEGLLPAASLERPPIFPKERVDYAATSSFRGSALRAAFESFAAGRAAPALRRSFAAFCRRSRGWLEDWALFASLKQAHAGVQWTLWPAPLRDREPKALAQARRALATPLAQRRFEQWCFARQWQSLRADCAAEGVGLIGDVPIFVAHDSADVWANRDLFFLDARGEPTVVAGVPPDYFSRTGQRWGNPVYRWARMARDGYAWWVARLESTLERFDAVRLDHFIGFHRHWEIPAGEPTAVRGRFRPGPGEALFAALRTRLDGKILRARGRSGEGAPLPFIAEDLGLITPEVKALRDRLGLPGIKILQFAFGTDASAPDFLPHAWTRRAVGCTGTHDNDTIVGWFRDPTGQGARTREQRAQNERERQQALDYLGAAPEAAAAIHLAFVRTVSASVADLAMVPMQDLLGLGSEARMNLPGTAEGNWEWRMAPGAAGVALARRLGHLTRLYGRDAPAGEAGREP